MWSEETFEPLVAAVIADGGRFVAVAASDDDRAAFTSTDGRTWQTYPLPDPSTEECDPDVPPCLEEVAEPGPMVRLGDTLYSFGRTPFFNDVTLAVGWRWVYGATEEPESSYS